MPMDKYTNYAKMKVTSSSRIFKTIYHNGINQKEKCKKL